MSKGDLFRTAPGLGGVVGGGGGGAAPPPPPPPPDRAPAPEGTD
jgi:hypothetical protein